MPSIVRPTLILKIGLDQHVCSQEDIDGIKRAYSYIAPVLVHKLPVCPNEKAHNNLRFIIKLRRAYWDANDTTSCAQWDAVMPKWLRNMLYKVFSTVTAVNAQFAEYGQLTMLFQWLELDFEGNALICVKTNTDSSVDYDAVVRMVEQVRCLYAQGVLSGNVSCVRIPSIASYQVQLEQARVAAKTIGEKAVAEEQARFKSRIAITKNDISDVQRETVDGFGEVAGLDDMAQISEVDEPVFSWPQENISKLDMHIWGIEFVDGTAREWDSSRNAFRE